MRWRHDSNGYPYICDHAGHVLKTYNIARRCRLPNSKMAAIRPEVEITFERREMAPRFQLLPPTFGCARLEYDTVDIARLLQTSDNQDGGDRNRKWK